MSSDRNYRILPDGDHDTAWFIDHVLIANIAKVIDSGAGYLAFGLIAQGIVVVGALVDGCELQMESRTDRRFKETIRHFFPSRYAAHNNPGSGCFFHEDLRLALAHVVKPNGNIAFIGRREATEQGITHLMMKDYAGQPKLVFVLEEFFEDFKSACQRAKPHFKHPHPPKLSLGYLSVGPA